MRSPSTHHPSMKRPPIHETTHFVTRSNTARIADDSCHETNLFSPPWIPAGTLPPCPQTLQSIRTQNRGTLFPAKQSETTVRRLKTQQTIESRGYEPFHRGSATRVGDENQRVNRGRCLKSRVFPSLTCSKHPCGARINAS